MEDKLSDAMSDVKHDAKTLAELAIVAYATDSNRDIAAAEKHMQAMVKSIAHYFNVKEESS